MSNKSDKSELKVKKTISWKVYFAYLRSGCGILGIFFIILMFVSAQASIIATDYWLFKWSSNEESQIQRAKKMTICLKNLKYFKECFIFLNGTTKFDNKTLLNQMKSERIHFYKIYLVLVSTSVVLVVIRSVFYFLISVRCSKVLYERLFLSVKNTSIKFFELNPLGIN